MTCVGNTCSSSRRRTALSAVLRAYALQTTQSVPHVLLFQLLVGHREIFQLSCFALRGFVCNRSDCGRNSATPDIRAAVAEVIDDFTLEPAAPDADLEIVFRPADQAHATEVANQLAARLQPRLRRVRLRLAE